MFMHILMHISSSLSNTVAKNIHNAHIKLIFPKSIQMYTVIVIPVQSLVYLPLGDLNNKLNPGPNLTNLT